MDLIEMFLKGGFVMWPILLSSVIGLAIVIDRALALKRSKVNISKFVINLRSFIRKKDIEGAIAECLKERTPVANIIRKGLKKYHLGHQRVRESIEAAGQQEVVKLERGLTMLATISGVAPLLGFLGTVTGMISAFMTLQSLKGNATPADLAGGIWEALITTAFGLGVGIPALVIYNYFTGAIAKLVSDMQLVSTEIADAIEEVSLGSKSSVDDIDIDV